MIIQRRIDPQPLHPTAAAKAGTVARQAAGSGDAPGGAPAAARAGVAVSTTAATATSRNGDFDTAKVERIRADLAACAFRVDPGAIADGLIADAKAFLAHGLV
jgi:flagellar biosynthesis anti-sigma factor FlgM